MYFHPLSETFIIKKIFTPHDEKKELFNLKSKMQIRVKRNLCDFEMRSGSIRIHIFLIYSHE